METPSIMASQQSVCILSTYRNIFGKLVCKENYSEELSLVW